MTETKWTPGPLNYLFIGANASGAHHTYIIDGKSRKIGVCWGGSDEKDANARLWSAAPDLYAATDWDWLIELEKESLDDDQGGDNDFPIKLTVGQIRDLMRARRKARGE